MISLRLRAATALLSATAALTVQPVHGAVQPPQLQHSGLELASAAPARALRTVRWGAAPASRHGTWRRWIERPLPGQQLRRAAASWDEATAIPSRIVVSGLPAPGTVHSADQARKTARRLLDRHLGLLSPGASPNDYVLTANHEARGLRSVGFGQRHRGLEVLGGQVTFRFRSDSLVAIGSEALPHVDAEPPTVLVDGSRARDQALQWLRADAPDSSVLHLSGPLILPLVGPHAVLGYRTVVRVIVSSQRPRAEWAVYLDATTGAPVAREQRLRFAAGTVLFDAPLRYPAAGRAELPAPLLDLTVDGAAATTDSSGIVTFADGGPVAVELTAQGSEVNIDNMAGDDATITSMLPAAGTVTWSAIADEPVDAQLSAFVHVSLAKAHARSLAPEMSWLATLLDVNVNIDDRCNAYYDGQTLNFFLAGGPCENTARVADVVHHEFGHAFHHHAVQLGTGQLDPALGEGLSDYFAASLSNDPGMGRGFFLDDTPLRHIDPPDSEHVWPYDIVGDEHYTGLIIAGALWDLRKALEAKLGTAEGAARTDALYYQAMKNATDIPSMYVEVLVADDDDGDLNNGTPHGCEINQAFGDHGLRAMVIDATPPSVLPADGESYPVDLSITGLIASCNGEGVEQVELHWRLRDDRRDVNVEQLTGGPEHWHTTIPVQAAGQVVQYRLLIHLSDDGLVTIPSNRADPMLEFFVGEVVPLYCTDFEIDPELEGWTHGLSTGEGGEGADDWQWGEPVGKFLSGDPSFAFSGSHVFGNDLGHGQFDGNYQADKVNFAASPIVSVGEFEEVRLQYRRWLNVEDGHFDQATIYANETPLWTNFDSLQGDVSSTHHMDRQWRFHDVDLSEQVVDGAVQVKFEISSDRGLQLGGWTLDDLCIVGVVPPPSAECGNGVLEQAEQCDDGNQDDGDGCDRTCRREAQAPPPIERATLTPRGGCSCRQSPLGSSSDDLWLAMLTAAAWALGRRRRRD